MTDLVKAFEELTAEIKEYEAKKIRLTEREANLKLSINAIHKEIQEFGVSPEALVSKIAELEKQTEEAIKLLKEKMTSHVAIEEITAPEEPTFVTTEVEVEEIPVKEVVEELKQEVVEEKEELAKAVVDNTLSMFDDTQVVHQSEKIEPSKEAILESALENIPNKFEAASQKVNAIDLDDLLN